MRFDDAVNSIRTLTELRRIAGAHVVDHRQLDDDELRQAIIKVKPQYIHTDTISKNLQLCLYRDPDNNQRVISRIILVDVLLHQYDFLLPTSETEEKVIAWEQVILDRSNEVTILDLACGQKDSQRYRDLELYSFILSVAWENEDEKTPDEVNLLRKLRVRLGITEMEHRVLEAKLGKYPKPSNVLHTRSEVNDVRRHLQSLGLLLSAQQDDGEDVDVIPEEQAQLLRNILSIEIRTDSYRALMSYRPLRRKEHLTDVLERQGVPYGRYDTVETLVGRVIEYVPPSKAIASSTPVRFGLKSDELAAWCKELSLSPSGSVEERVHRVIAHFDQLRPRLEVEPDERGRWYEFYEELAWRKHDVLRSQHVIDKDLETEAKFEDATSYLFAEKLNHTPLQQRGSNHPDGLLSLQSNYLMWDNKSKETPVNLRDHIAQFDGYMSGSDKPVPVFMVIGPDFTQESETEALHYHAKYMERNIVLITAADLKRLAEEWSSPKNKSREDSFPLGLLAATGRFERERLGKLY